MRFQAHGLKQFRTTGHVTVNHIDDLEVPAVQLVGTSGTAILDQHHVEALVGFGCRPYFCTSMQSNVVSALASNRSSGSGAP